MEKDFYFSDDGDFILDENNDLLDTSYDSTRSLLQSIKALLNYNKNEWPGASRKVGCNLVDFIGAPNTTETAAKIKSRIISEFTKNGLLKLTDFNVDIYPLSVDTIVIEIIIKINNKIMKYTHYFSFIEKSAMRRGE